VEVVFEGLDLYSSRPAKQAPADIKMNRAGGAIEDGRQQHLEVAPA